MKNGQVQWDALPMMFFFCPHSCELLHKQQGCTNKYFLNLKCLSMTFENVMVNDGMMGGLKVV